MTKTRLEKIIYSFTRAASPQAAARSRESLGDYIARFMREMEEAPGEHPQTPLRPLDHQELQGSSCSRRVLQSPAQFDFATSPVLRRLRRLVHRQELPVNTIGRHVKS
ncbi:MAG: hypothetical protein ACLR3T_00135 [Alistipes finegoldii]